MPNCDFYAAGEDFRLIVEFILAKTSCRIFELSSGANLPLVEFRSFADLKAAQSSTAQWPPLLNLWPTSANPDVRVRKNRYPAHDGQPAWTREELDGWGTIQLCLRIPRAGGLSPSHTNHNSERRAVAWSGTYPEVPAPSSWDFAAVTRESSRINRFIRKLATSKRGSRLVLPGAAALFAAGTEALLN